MQLGGTTIRVACNQAGVNSFVNELGSRAPVIPRAGSVSIPCAIFIDDPSVATNLLSDLGNILTADIVIRAGSATGTVLFEQVIPASAFNATLTYVQWKAGTGAHFTFSLTPTDTNLATQTIWIAVGVSTSNAGDISLVFCANAQIKDYGIFNAAAPAAPDYTSWSKAESDGRYAPAGDAPANRPLITGTTGGGATNLDGVATVGLTNYSSLFIRRLVGGKNVYQLWVLEPDTDDNTGAENVTPADHDSTTNPRSWRLRL